MLYEKRITRGLLTLLLYSLIFFFAWQYRESKLINEEIAPVHNLVSIHQNLLRVPSEEQATLLYFFAPWCKICHLSMDNINDIAEDEDYRNIQMVAVAQDWTSIEKVNEFILDKSITTQVVLGTEESKYSYQIKGYPTYYLIDKKGQIVAGSFGYSSLIGMKAFLALHASAYQL
jgi:thioredoxin-related protein